MYEEITKRKKMDELLTPAGFASLLQMLLLFNREGRFYEHSGFVTAALLDYDDPVNQVSILGVWVLGKGLMTFKLTRPELTEMLNQCDAFIGKTPEESFLLET